MKEVAFIFLGWVLGLASPMILDAINERRKLSALSAALRTELDNLQFRLAISSFSLLNRHGKVDSDFLAWIKPIIERYSGNEPVQSIKALIEKWETDTAFGSAADSFFRAEPGVGSSIKVFKAGFLDANLESVARMPIGLQRKIHEFRNQLDILNQDIALIEPRTLMTFSSSISDANHAKLITDIDSRTMNVQRRLRIVAQSIGNILLDL